MRTRVPLSFLVRVLAIAASVNGEERVRVLPAVTSMALLAWLRTKVRAVEKVPVARKPTSVVPSTFSLTELPEWPSAASELAATTPARMSITAVAPPKVLPALASRSVPGPDLVRS